MLINRGWRFDPARVARGLLGSAAQVQFLEALHQPGEFSDLVRSIPAHLISDDTAALDGAARYYTSL